MKILFLGDVVGISGCEKIMNNLSNQIKVNQIDFVTIASAGNAADFGDLSAVSESFAGSGNNIKGIVGGGNQGPYAGMDVITIASTGGGSDFGDLTTARRDLGSTSNQIRQITYLLKYTIFRKLSAVRPTFSAVKSCWGTSRPPRPPK